MGQFLLLSPQGFPAPWHCPRRRPATLSGSVLVRVCQSAEVVSLDVSADSAVPSPIKNTALALAERRVCSGWLQAKLPGSKRLFAWQTGTFKSMPVAWTGGYWIMHYLYSRILAPGSVPYVRPYSSTGSDRRLSDWRT